jgi:hypothetical protein
MGIGDNLMAAAQVKRMYAARPVPVCVVGRGDRVVWSEVFENNPKIARRLVGAQRLVNGPGMRPYIAGRTDTKWMWRRFREQEPGEIFLTHDETIFGEPYAGMVMVEPNVKQNGHTNKAWPFVRWQALVNEMRVPIVQAGTEGTRWLDGVTRVVTPTFRHACAVLSACRAFVGTEGALHHAAAALNVRAVVLWSHFISPDVTGYAGQVNIRHAGDPCGLRVPCARCAESMNAISVDEVAVNLRGVCG